MTDRELAVEQLQANYKVKGFITNDENNLTDVELSSLCEKLSSVNITIISDSEFEILKNRTDNDKENSNFETYFNDNEEFQEVFDVFSRLTQSQIKRCLQILNEKYNSTTNSEKDIVQMKKELSQTIGMQNSFRIEDLLYFSVKNSGTGRLLSNGQLILYKGAKLSFIPYQSARSDFSDSRKRYDSFIENGITTEDIIFKSPTGAAKFICGYSINGRISWKNKYGIRLKELLGE